ncbi:MAG: 3-methyl-2-oxobutanoate hydroxymethyltransferase, partial [bacterium]
MDGKKVTAPSLKEMKERGEKIVSLTAYDCLLAAILDEIGIDVTLVGDSGAMVFAGHDTTLPITMDEMIYHVKAVGRGTRRALLVADMPFLSYQVSAQKAIKNAGRFLKETPAEAVKVEGGAPVAETVQKMVQLGIPVMGHLGLTPQSINSFGGYKVRGKTSAEATRLLEDAQILSEAGVF